MFELLQILRNPVAYLVSLIGGGLMLLAVFYTMFAHEAEGGYGIGDFASDMATVMNLPSIPGIYENAERTAMAATGGMADALPPGRDGWTRRGWEADDGALLIAASADLAPDARFLGESIVDEFLEVARGDVSGVLETYARGDERIVVMIRRLPVAYAGGGQLSLAERESTTRQMLDTGLAPLAVHGVALGGYSIPPAGEELPFERLRGALSGQIAIEVASNAGRAALVALLSGIDMEALNRFADVPDPIVSADKGVVAAAGYTAGVAARGAAAPEVTRGPAPGVGPVTPETERRKTGVCIRRAGKRTCE